VQKQSTGHNGSVQILWRHSSRINDAYTKHCKEQKITKPTIIQIKRITWSYTGKIIRKSNGSCKRTHDPDTLPKAITRKLQLEYLDVTVLRRGEGEIRVEAGRAQHADKCGGECSYRRSQAFITELEMSACAESKRMTNHNTPQLSRIRPGQPLRSFS
jgi:hypothetical protein